MATGIYLEQFGDAEAWYIGQSVNLETQHLNHLSKLRKGTHTKSMQKAFELYGTPEFSVFEECHHSWLNELEGYVYKSAISQKLNVLNINILTSNITDEMFEGLKKHNLLKSSVFSLINNFVTIKNIL